QAMDQFARLTGRSYHLFDYYGDPQAERVLMLMGSGAETARETVDYLTQKGERVGLLQVHLYRPFSPQHLLKKLPATLKALAVLDRTKEPGAMGEPLYQDVVAALGEAAAQGDLSMEQLPRIIGGRYGLSSKEFTPAMVKAVLDELKKDSPKNHFTVGINDDLSHTSLEIDPGFHTELQGVTQAMFFGLGSDGTVGANKNSIKIIGEETDFYVQGYFVYDSKKSGSRTVSHLRFGPRPIRSTYLIESADFIGCHQFNFLEKIDLLARAAPGAVFLLNSPYGPEEVWDRLPREVQAQLIEKQLKFYVIDGYRVAQAAGMGTRINTVMQTCFFAISGVLPREEAIAKIKAAIEKTYGKKGQEIVRKNFAAVDQALSNLHQVPLPERASSRLELPPAVPPQAPEFVRKVIAAMLAGRGDELPVSALPIDGTYPSGTARWEKRNISLSVPIWEPELCIQCGNCSFVCPHSCIRAKFYPEAALDRAPEGFPSEALRGRGYPEQRYTLQVYVEDCTGCDLCVEACPVRSEEIPGKRAINMGEKAPILAQERRNLTFFESLPQVDRTRVDFSTVRGVQYLEPLFEFSGACTGCGETPYLKVLTQLFGDRLLVANATGCSSIYGGNLPTTPWSLNREGRGPAWSNSLFEDNAEFGLGMRLGADKQLQLARELLRASQEQIGSELVEKILSAPQRSEGEIHAQRERVGALKDKLRSIKSATGRDLLSLADHLVRRSAWIVGGDGWAYDIGYGGLDHVLASGRDLNVLVLDTEVYSNTGGQASKATPLGAVAKFAAAGKPLGKKDLALMAIAYGNIYVARVAMGANSQQTLLALREAEAYPGPALIIAYSHCIAHGIDMRQGLRQQYLAVESGSWPLFRYNPALREIGQNPMELDSQRPAVPLEDYAYNEMRYKMLVHSHPQRAEQLLKLAKADLEQKWTMYEFLARREAPPAANGRGELQAQRPQEEEQVP
ncbi:MAG TPA: pyruvate:ferredoxin (flavodoxin) oxidoreductase, partial [Candidatus Fraserbacteria bacterium]|nr:pyruvate:ferredoxin (flavodoxin) oxidoreductase [Candidatus Fraserbacteria bacterium]